MPNYKYKAKNQMGKTVEGTLQAENEADLVAQLRQRRTAVALPETSERAARGWKALWQHRFNDFQRLRDLRARLPGLPFNQFRAESPKRSLPPPRA